MIKLVIQNAVPTAPEKTSHKFFIPEKTRAITDDHEVKVKVIVGDEESEGRYTIISDLWKRGFSVPSHYHAQHFETFYLLSGEAEWTVGCETHNVKPGEAVYIPARAAG
jgi:quercetin dioxygenase-like cupin family protein